MISYLRRNISTRKEAGKRPKQCPQKDNIDKKIQDVRLTHTPQNSTPLQDATSLTWLDGSCFIFSKDIYDLRLSFSQTTKKQELISLHADGSRTQFFVGDMEGDVVVGLDFGTSTLKCFIRDPDNEKTFPVVFCGSQGASAFHLPTVIYLSRSGVYALEPSSEAIRIDGLKLKLIKEPLNFDYRCAATAFLALALRHIRAWFADNLAEWYGNTFQEWSVHMGVPSESTDTLIAKTWEKILHAAWDVSTHEGPIVRTNIVEALNSQDNCSQDLSKCDLCPEISAAIHAIISCNLDHENGQLYTVVDVGASTVDISAFFFTRGKEKIVHETTLLGPQVHSLGTSVCHGRRVLALVNFLAKNSRGQSETEKLRNHIETEKILIPSSVLPDSVDSYIDGISLSDNRYGPDAWLIRELATSLRTRIQQAFARVHHSPHPVKVLRIGGGSNAAPYRDVFKRAVFCACKEKAEEIRINVIPPLTFSSVGPRRIAVREFWGRLSVAYGLALGKKGKTITETLDMEVDEENDGGLGEFISKEMV